MNTAVAAVEHALTAPEMTAHVQRIQQVMKAVMKENTHFGKIPGAGDKLTLLKPGAEVLCATFRIAPTFREEEIPSSDGSIRYRVRCTGTHQTSGIILGEGMGEASTNEEKYKWREARGKEYDNAPEDHRRVKYKRGQNGDYEVQQIRTEPADVANTVLKMACKRAQVAMTLNVTAASDIFTQDLEDLDPGDTGGGATGGKQQGRPKTDQPRQSSGGGTGRASDKQVKLIYARLEGASMEASILCKHFSIESVVDLPFGKVDEALDYIKNYNGG